MQDALLWGVLGGVAGLAAVWLVRREAKRRAETLPNYEAQVWALCLAGAALVYVGFALFNGAPGRWIGIELAGLAAYGLIAVIAANKWPLLIGPGWLAHGFWDQLLHAGGQPAFVPEWYVPLCLGFGHRCRNHADGHAPLQA